ncbi:MAG: T9SS type A sorting domain-containing protein [Candidatus Paceibacterota bacterium]|jgi:hypothetical protein
MRKMFFFISFFCFFFPIFAQSGLKIERPNVISIGALQQGTQEIERFLVNNTSSEDVTVTGFEYVIQTGGLLPQDIIRSVSLYDGETELISLATPKYSMQSQFLTGERLYVNLSSIITSQTQKEFSVRADVCGLGSVKIVFSRVYGLGKNSMNFYQAFGNETDFLWRSTMIQKVGQVSISPIELIVAPGSKRFRIPVVIDVNNGVQCKSIDANFIHYRTQSGSPKLIFHQGYSVEWTNEWNAKLMSWGGDLRMGPGFDASRLLLFGSDPISGPNTVYIYASLADELKEGEKIPIAFGSAFFNDDQVIKCVENNIIIGPRVIFGDANNDGSKEITSGDLVATLDLLYGLVPYDEQFLKKKLAADVNGNGNPDDNDLYHQLQMFYDPNYTPPVLWDMWSNTIPSIPEPNQTPIGLISKSNGEKTDYYFSGGTVNSATIKIPLGVTIEKGGALDLFKVGEKDGKQLLVFADKKEIDVSKPVFSIQNNGKEIKISGSVNGGTPVIISSTTDVKNESTTPIEFNLLQNYPNPFNPVTTITYQLPEQGNVSLKVFDILGNEVQTLVNEEKEAGSYTVQFDASSLASGMYIYRLQVNDYSSIKKMILTK